MQTRSHAHERGSMLITTTFLVLLMAGLASALLLEVQGERAAVDRHETSLYALQTVEAGLIQAELEIQAQVDSTADGIGNRSGTLHLGTYDVSAQKSPLSHDRWILTGTGRRGLSTRRIEIGLRRRGSGAFVEGLFSKEQFTLNGNSSIDSFDSRLGSYASQVVRSDAAGPYANENGHIGSNRGIVVHGSSNAIRGNAIPGVLHQVQVSGSPILTGDTFPRTVEVPIPDPAYAAFLAAHNGPANATAFAVGAGAGSIGNPPGAYNATRKSLTVKNKDTVTLPAGTYFFSDVDIKGEMRVVGDVTIYLTGAFVMAGQGILNRGWLTSSSYHKM